jgi:tRNA G18 (ribose-2'-O)-methylase SpoU
MIFVVLDNIRSMENVGSVFRTCDAAGVDKIYLCGITPKPPRKEIDKTALGAVDFVDWEYRENIEALIAEFKELGTLIVSLEQDDRSVSCDAVSTENNLALIIGNEVDGISKSTLDLSDQIIEIPMHGQKNSLNVSVACGIALFELIKKK